MIRHFITLTRAMRVPFTASMTPGENCRVTPGSTVSVAIAPMIRSSLITHGLLYESIRRDCRRKPPFLIRLHSGWAPARATRAKDMAVMINVCFMLTSYFVWNWTNITARWLAGPHNNQPMLAIFFITLTVTICCSKAGTAHNLQQIQEHS